MNHITKMKKMKDAPPIKIMTHLVAGYPSIQANIDLALAMEKAGVDFIEVQIPFTDPMADGPTIMHANQMSLNNKTQLRDCFELMENLSKQLHIPLLFMTYANVPYRLGMETFIKKCKKSRCKWAYCPRFTL